MLPRASLGKVGNDKGLRRSSEAALGGKFIMVVDEISAQFTGKPADVGSAFLGLLKALWKNVQRGCQFPSKNNVYSDNCMPFGPPLAPATVKQHVHLLGGRILEKCGRRLYAFMLGGRILVRCGHRL